MDDSLYVCLFSNGHIKVGRSNNPIDRIATHVDRVACLGVTLVNSSDVECAGSAAIAESELIAVCAAHATERNKNEWFVGLNYADVCQWAQFYASAVPTPLVSIEIDEERPNFRDVLRALKCQGFKQTDLAQLCGVSQPTISDLSTGVIKEPSYYLGAALMRLLNQARQPV